MSLPADAIHALSGPTPWRGQPHSVTLSLPPFGALLFRRTGP